MTPAAVDQVLATTEMEYAYRALSHDMGAYFMLLDHGLRQLREMVNPAEESSTDEAFAYVEACVGEARRFLRDMHALRQTGQVEMEPARVSLSEMFREIAYEQHGFLEQHGVQLKIAARLPDVWINPVRVKQVFTNLIRNAVKHGSQAAEPRIEVVLEHRATTTGGERPLVGIRLWDNGVGIPLGKHEEIFLPGVSFHHLDESGSGLGLAICRKIIEHYGGTIQVDTSWPAGACFVLQLPAAEEPLERDLRADRPHGTTTHLVASERSRKRTAVPTRRTPQ